eukprot:GGOE01004441.1.p1 GENE.GGOE01004441.1~~GGOE01004441.1.p1  ORF type:complete len:194 (+),score=34.27 GGOE01004441.1:40-582(+)
MSHLCTAAFVLVAIFWASALPPHTFNSHVLLDERSNFTLQWTADTTTGVLQLCATAACPPAQYLSLGFGDGNRMRNTDIVAAFLSASGEPVIRTYYAIRSVGFPDGEPTLSIADQRAEFGGRTATLCFSRPFVSGHHTVGAAMWVSWAMGHLWRGDLDDHGTQRGQRLMDLMPPVPSFEL